MTTPANELPADLPADLPVVAAVDGSENALGGALWAAEFAARHALPLALLHVTPRLGWHFTTVEAPADAEQRFDGDAVLGAAEAAVRAAHPDLVIQTVARKGSVAATLVEFSQSARLLALGSGAAGHRVLGGHAVRVAHGSGCPLVVWRPAAAKRTGKPLPVVVGVDESDGSARALAEAFDIARGLHAPLTVAHMWEIDAAVGMGDLGGQGYMDWPLLELLQSQQRQRMDDLVAPLAREYPNAHVTKIFEDVGPAKGLADLSGGAQLLVVGSHGRGRLAASLLGSVSQNVLHHAECPVLVVR